MKIPFNRELEIGYSDNRPIFRKSLARWARELLVWLGMVARVRFSGLGSDIYLYPYPPALL
jgi:hypothetical protein